MILPPDYEFVSLSHPDEYPFNEGRIISSKGLDIAVSEYEDYFTEIHAAHSNALQSVMRENDTYFVGPMARYSLNFDKLTPLAQSAAKEVGLGKTCYNPFQSIVVRAVETLYACDEALRIIENYEVPPHPYVDIEPKAGIGKACTEAPRGSIYHRYELDEQGHVVSAKIVPPTSQNQRAIEADLRQFVEPRLGLDVDKLTWQCEQAVRNYDPCISCATHFLKLHIEYQD